MINIASSQYCSLSSYVKVRESGSQRALQINATVATPCSFGAGYISAEQDHT